MTGFSKAIRLVDVGLLLYEQRYSVHEEETVGYFHFGKKKTKIDTKWKCIGTFLGGLNCQQKTAKKIKEQNTHKGDQCCYFRPHSGSSRHIFAYFTAYIDLHTDFWETYCLSERKWILLAILLCQYSHQLCLIQGLVNRIFSSSRVIFNTRPFPFILLKFFRFNLCQEYTTCLQYLQTPSSSPGTIFSLEWIWREE